MNILRTIEGMDEFMLPLDRLLTEQFIPILLNSSITATERELFSLPIRLLGLNIPIFAEKASNDYEISKMLTAPLAATQGKELPDENAKTFIKAHANKSETTLLKVKADSIEEKLSVDTLRYAKQAREKGAGS